jgi:putative toxin-antitoxin system antitoxin component (TIGR02293 family)
MLWSKLWNRGDDMAELRVRGPGGGVESGGSEHGYVRLMGLAPADSGRLIELVEEGLPFASLECFGENAGFSQGELSELIQVKPRTLSRRKSEGRLRPDESDRLLRLCRVFGEALDLFEGDASAAREWLHSSLPALGGAVPLRMARTEVGAREVERVIGRIEHGVFS